MRPWQTLMRTLLYPAFAPIVRMPGNSYPDELCPTLSRAELGLRHELFAHVSKLAVDIGERSLERFDNHELAANYIADSFRGYGLSVEEQAFSLGQRSLRNIVCQIPAAVQGAPILIIGAHYDTVVGTPGADDNATGVAALLTLACWLKRSGIRPAFTVRFVAFANEETYAYESMGSYVYAKACRAKQERLVGMLSLEMLGVYSSREGSQKYPWPFNLFYPTKANFVGFIGNYKGRQFVRRCVELFRKEGRIPSQGCAAPSWVPDVSRSDHYPFWIFGYPALMVTDTSNFRYPLYHTAEDSIDKLDFDKLTLVVCGLQGLLRELLQS